MVYKAPQKNVQCVLDTALKVKFRVSCADEMPQNLEITKYP